MGAWPAQVEQPFDADAGFRRAVALTFAALPVVVAVAVLNSVSAAPLARVTVVVPVALLVAAAVVGRASSARTRPGFADRDAWRDAERRAVAAALRGLLGISPKE